MKKRFVKKLLVLAVVSTLSLSACGSEVLEEIAPSDVVEQVEDVVSEVAEVVENATKEELAETEEVTETTETEEVEEEGTEDTTEEETTEVKEEQSVSEEKPSAEVTQKEEKPKEEKPSTKPVDKPKEETPKAEEKPVEQKPTETQTPATTPVETPSTPVAETPTPTPAPEPSRGTECASSSDGYHLAVHKTEKQNCEHGDLSYDVCAYCGVIYNKVETGTGTGHDYKEHNASGRPVKCDDPTWVDVFCDKCGAKDPNHPSYHSEVPHNYEVSIVKEADCTEDGCIVYKCTGCGDWYEEKTDDALGHDVQTWYDEEWDETITRCIHKGCKYGLVKVDGYHLNE